MESSPIPLIIDSHGSIVDHTYTVHWQEEEDDGSSNQWDVLVCSFIKI
jgi:hypothetical protein